jgi:ABC-type spermidine/putrescine transport system permease subunit II
MTHSRTAKIIALIIAAIILAIMLVAGILMAYWTFEFTIAFGGTITAAWTVAVLIPVFMLVVGLLIVWLAGRLLCDDDRTAETNKRDSPRS